MRYDSNICYSITRPYHTQRVSALEFISLKQSLPFKQLPILEIGSGCSVVAGQSTAILRYVGKLAGLYPEDALEAAVNIESFFLRL